MTELNQDVVPNSAGQQNIIKAAFPIGVLEGTASHGVVDDIQPGGVKQLIEHLSPTAHRRFVENIGFYRRIA
ncbi:hypothetical protein D3C87_1675700 [compost metagenome]